MAAFKILLIAIFCVGMEVALADTEATCDCGVFKYPTPETTDTKPLISKSPKFDFQCDAAGKESCSKMCKALAGASKEEGPKKICELIENASEPFVPVIYSKACDDKDWTFTGLKSTLEICCKNKEAVPCQ